MKKFLALAIVVLVALSLASSVQASTAGQRDVLSTQASTAGTKAPTAGQRNALSSAKSYLRVSSFSKSGLVEQLEFEGFSRSEARWAVARVRVSWYAQAVKSAKAYLRTSSFSRQGLIEQLEFEGFTPSQARYGVKRAYR